MARSAKVTSIDALQTFAGALRRFGHVASSALEELELELQRAVDWIQEDRKSYWKHELHRGWEQVAEARVNLQRAQTIRRMVDREPSCVDERRALEKARRRARIAEEKVERARHWSRMVERAVNEYRGSAGKLAGWLETDLPQGLALLGRMSEALESYVRLESSGESTVADAAAIADEADPQPAAVEEASAEPDSDDDNNKNGPAEEP